MSFAVFFFPNTSLQILDEFIDEAYEGWFSMVPDGDVGASTCILETTDLDSIAHGSRKPMRAFKSLFSARRRRDPYLGKGAQTSELC
jgi:hypothetical protein